MSSFNDILFDGTHDEDENKSLEGLDENSEFSVEGYDPNSTFGVSLEAIKEQNIDTNELKDSDPNDNDELLLNALEYLENSDSICQSVTESINYDEMRLNNVDIKCNLGENLLGIEGFYSSNHISLEGFKEFMAKIGQSISSAFRKLMQSVANKIRSFQNLLATVVVNKYSKMMTKNLNDWQKSWTENAAEVEISAYNYTNSIVNPLMTVKNIIAIVQSSLTEESTKFVQTTQKLSTKVKELKQSKTENLAQKIETMMNEHVKFIFTPLIKSTLPLVNLVKQYVSDITVDIGKISDVNVKESKSFLANVRSAYGAVGKGKFALALILKDTSKSSKIAREKKTITSLFKDFNQAKSFVLDRSSFTQTLLMLKQTIASSRLFASNFRRDIATFQKLFVTQVGHKGSVKLIREQFSLENRGATTGLTAYASISAFGTNMVVQLIRRTTSVIAACKACAKKKSTS